MSRRISATVQIGVVGAILGIGWGAILGIVWATISWSWLLALACWIAAAAVGSVVVFALWLEQFTRNYGPHRF